MRQRHIAIALEAATHAFESGQRTLHGSVFDPQLHGHSHSRQGIEHVVVARQVQYQGQVWQGDPIAALHCEMHLAVLCAHIHCTHLGAFVQTIGGHRAGNVLHDGLNTGVVRAHHRGAIKRHAVQKLHKSGLQAGQIVAIGFHVVGIDVGHHRHHGQQVQERCIGLVCLDHDVVARAQLGIRAGTVQAPPNHKRGVKACFGQDTGHQTGGGGFAVGACNGNALFHAHQFSQHDRSWHDRNVAFAGSQHFRVVRFDCGGCDNRIGVFHIGGRVADMGLNAQGCQAVQGGAVRQVRARDLVAQVQQHFGNATHA